MDEFCMLPGRAALDDNVDIITSWKGSLSEAGSDSVSS